ncbi:MAG: hypothetical protein KC635_07095, partial [Myxococcales bacterium]|nr:hypothetical protein [Myxococcales bacterium]
MHVKLMAFATLSGAILLLSDYQEWRIALVLAIPVIMGTIEMLLVRRTSPDDFDRVFLIMGSTG